MSTMNKLHKKPQNDLNLRVIVVWFITIMFSSYQFSAQVIAGPMTAEIMQSYKLNAVTVSYAVSSFFYVYLLMQLPAGIILDRYSSRYLLPGGFMICALGSVLMGLSDNVYNFSLARMLCAFGGSFGFIGAMRILRNYVPMVYIPLFIGLTEMQGFIFTSVCEAIVSYYLPQIGFKKVLLNFGVCGIFLAFLVYICLHPKLAPKHEYAAISKSDGLTKQDIIILLQNKQIWLLGLIGFGFFSLVTSFAALWGVPTLINIHHLTLGQSAQALSAIFLGIALGGPIIGQLATNHKRQKFMSICSGLLCAILLSIILKMAALNFIAICLLMFFLGMFSCCYLLCFSIGNAMVPAKLSGTCMGFINMVTMASALILQPLMGYIISYNGVIGFNDGVPIYPADSYRMAGMFLVAIFVGVSLLSTMLKLQDKTIGHH